MPNGESAVVDPVKVREYLLSTEHENGRHKARLFSRLGYHRQNWMRLFRTLEAHATLDTAQCLSSNAYGEKYEIVGPVTGPNGRVATMLSVWIISAEAHLPRLVTAYPTEFI